MMKKFSVWYLVFVVACILTALTFAALIGAAFVDKHLGFWTKILFLIVAVTVAIAVFIAGEHAFDPTEGIQGFIKPHILALAIIGITTIFGTMSTAYSLLSPRTATETEVGIIEKTVRDTKETAQDTNKRIAKIETRLDETLPDFTNTLSSIEGVWGERGCAAFLYEIAVDLETNAITLRQLRPDTGYRSRGTALRLENHSIISEIREPASERGQISRYTLRGDGDLQTLMIAMGAVEASVELDRCSTGAKQ